MPSGCYISGEKQSVPEPGGRASDPVLWRPAPVGREWKMPERNQGILQSLSRLHKKIFLKCKSDQDSQQLKSLWWPHTNHSKTGLLTHMEQQGASPASPTPPSPVHQRRKAMPITVYAAPSRWGPHSTISVNTLPCPSRLRFCDGKVQELKTMAPGEGRRERPQPLLLSHTAYYHEEELRKQLFLTPGQQHPTQRKEHVLQGECEKESEPSFLIQSHSQALSSCDHITADDRC
ncbi:hypothetical protein TREES_T100015568 [Tupaia chinensis]|uniref:Uncharacterized protein n=1 Tax=Tupaia chinensis TaxID=246437 RepID=L9LB71_TUPCH|nr:hypothetical protein TREES_T100015568 [Tupaia chinensis]